MHSPLDYGLCRQTVTIYRRTGDTVERTVVENAWYRWQTKTFWDAQGSRQETLFTLILPAPAAVQVGDRIYDGVGPEVDAAQWAGFLPVHVPGLGQVQYVKPCCFMGQLCHTQAGRN